MKIFHLCLWEFCSSHFKDICFTLNWGSCGSHCWCRCPYSSPDCCIWIVLFFGVLGVFVLFFFFLVCVFVLSWQWICPYSFQLILAMSLLQQSLIKFSLKGIIKWLLKCFFYCRIWWVTLLHLSGNELLK